LISLMVGCLFPLIAPAADPPSPVPQADINDRVVQGLVAALEIGVPLFNRGDHIGCYRVYQGALASIKPMLASTPEVAQKIQSRMEKADGLGSPAQKAYELRNAIDEVRSTLRKPLWDRLGGETAVSVVVHDFVVAAAKNPKVNFTRNEQFKLDAATVTALERKLVELISAVTGGPLKYSGKDMKAVHTGMKITEEEFNALAEDLVAALKHHRVPQAEITELIGIVATTKKDIVGQ
jgi:hemoglobin